jgi:transposase
MAQGNHLKTYQKDFKQSAIQMAISSDRPMSHIAKELGINDNTLYNWVGT